MGLFSKKTKCDVAKLITQLKISLVDEMAEAFALSEVSLEADEHSQGIDITYSFVKRDISPIRKKISYQIKRKDIESETAEAVYQAVKAGLSRLVKVRLDEMRD